MDFIRHKGQWILHKKPDCQKLKTNLSSEAYALLVWNLAYYTDDPFSRKLFKGKALHFPCLFTVHMFLLHLIQDFVTLVVAIILCFLQLTKLF